MADAIMKCKLATAQRTLREMHKRYKDVSMGGAPSDKDLDVVMLGLERLLTSVIDMGNTHIRCNGLPVPMDFQDIYEVLVVEELIGMETKRILKSFVKMRGKSTSLPLDGDFLLSLRTFMEDGKDDFLKAIVDLAGIDKTESSPSA